MYREKPVAKWIGPYVVRGVSGKLVTLDTGDRIVLASIDKLKLYHPNHISKEDVSSNESQNKSNEIFQLEKAQLEALLERPRNTQVESVCVNTYIAKTKPETSPRSHDTDFKLAEKAEIDGLMSRQIWTRVKKSEVPNNANVLGGR